MHRARPIIVALVALCLAAFPLGMARADIAGCAGVGHAHRAAHPHATGESAHAHTHGDHRGDHMERADGGHAMGAALAAGQTGRIDAGEQRGADDPVHKAACCGFACHAVALVAEVGLTVPEPGAVCPRSHQEQQIGDARPASLDRPPRLG